MPRAMTLLAKALDVDRIAKISITLGAGNHTAWAAPFFPTRAGVDGSVLTHVRRAGLLTLFTEMSSAIRS